MSNVVDNNDKEIVSLETIFNHIKYYNSFDFVEDYFNFTREFSLLQYYFKEIIELNKVLLKLSEINEIVSNYEEKSFDNKNFEIFIKKFDKLYQKVFSLIDRCFEKLSKQCGICIDSGEKNLKKIENLQMSQDRYDTLSTYSNVLNFLHDFENNKDIIYGNLSSYNINKSISDEKNEKKRKDIDSKSNYSQGYVDTYENVVKELGEAIEGIDNGFLKMSAENELNSIEKIVSPKAIMTSRIVLEKLRKSSQLQLDLEALNEKLKYGFRSEFKDINKKMEDLKKILDKALKSEKLNNEDLTNLGSYVVEYYDDATDTVKYYTDSLDNGSYDLPENYSYFKAQLQKRSPLRCLPRKYKTGGKSL